MRFTASVWLLSITSSLLCSTSYAQSAAAITTPVLIDRDLSPAAGATVTIALGRLLAHTEDRFIPLRLFEDRGKLRGAANATYRLAKLALFDEPQENWFRVANHKLFWHVRRLR